MKKLILPKTKAFWNIFVNEKSDDDRTQRPYFYNSDDSCILVACDSHIAIKMNVCKEDIPPTAKDMNDADLDVKIKNDFDRLFDYSFGGNPVRIGRTSIFDIRSCIENALNEKGIQKKDHKKEMVKQKILIDIEEMVFEMPLLYDFTKALRAMGVKLRECFDIHQYRNSLAFKFDQGIILVNTSTLWFLVGDDTDLVSLKLEKYLKYD